LKFDETSGFDIDSKSAKLAQEAKEISDMIEQIKKQALLNQMANNHDETEVSSLETSRVRFIDFDLNEYHKGTLSSLPQVEGDQIEVELEFEQMEEAPRLI
jgi:hypothetical protein